jgi:hypothetical protein
MQKWMLVLTCLIAFLSFSDLTPAEETVKWLPIDRVDELYAKEPRPILVDVYTSWCGWCKVMDKKTYTHPALAAYINSHFYPVKFDAEYKGTVRFNNKQYAFDAQAESNMLAVYFLEGKMQYPTTVFLSSPGAPPAPVAGYLQPKDFERPLKYFGERANQKMSFDKFGEDFTPEWN